VKSVAIIGASLAGLRSAQELRAQGYDGEVVLVGDELHKPYDRPPLSKAFLAGTASRESLDLLDASSDLALTWRLGVRAERLDHGRVLLSDGGSLEPDGLVIATGGRARTLPGFADVEGVHTLRTLDDALALRSALAGSPRVVIVGAGFIGAEVASTCRSLGLDVTVLEALPAPLAPVLGPELAAVCAGLHVSGGTSLRCGALVDSLVTSSGRVTGVRLAGGAELPADVVVVGVGMTPATEWLAGSGLVVDNGVVCDSGLVTALPNVVAVGDVARFGGSRHEHWTNATEQAPVAVANLLAGSTVRSYIPSGYVWSDQYSARLQLAGHPLPGDEVSFVDGSPAEGAFVATYLRGGETVGVFAMNNAKLFNRLRRQSLRKPAAV